ncbi:hypothetical protein PWT90_05377 [Aphanocladium album]|nr:hypothetical protein PWT90_05377 [Aphanocladium album]
MSSPQPVTAPSPVSPPSNRQTALYDTKAGGAGGFVVNPAPTSQPHAHPTAYYVFDMLFKLVIACGIIGLVAVQATGVAEFKAQTKQGKSANSQLSRLAGDLATIRASISFISDKMQSISSNILDIRNIMNRG